MRKQKEQGRVYWIEHASWTESAVRLLDAARLTERLPPDRPLLIKPNLVEALPPPITTPMELVAAVIDYLRARRPDQTIIVGEGCGSKSDSTMQVFEQLGYTAMAAAKGVELVDLNEEPLVKRRRTACQRWPEMHLPRLVYESYLISVPVLKVHTLAGVTLTMKNMMGLAPPTRYQQGGHWKKASFHQGIQAAIFDLNRYRCADFTLLDASRGMREAHLWGPECDPPPNKLLAGFDPVAIDAHGACLLGRDWRKIGHIRKADGVLGRADGIELVRA